MGFPIFITQKEFVSQLSSCLSKHIGETGKNFTCVVKRNRDLKGGDFVVPKGHSQDLLSEEMLATFKRACQEKACGNGIQIQTVSASPAFPVCIFLHRGTVFQSVLSEVKKQGSAYGIIRYGHACERCHRVVLLHLSALTSKVIGPGVESCLPINCLRSLTLLNHMRQLLVTNRHTVRCVPSQLTSHAEHLFKLLEIDYPGPADLTEVTNRLKTAAMKSKYRCDRWQQGETEKQTTGFPCTSPPGEEDSCVSINLRQFLMDNPALTGFDKNINIADVIKNGHPTDLLHGVSCLEKEYCSCKQDSIGQPDVSVSVLHLTPHSRSFINQQVALLWRILSPAASSVKQVHLVHGPTVAPPSVKHQLTPETFYSLIENEMREAAVMKYGDQVQGPGWERSITCLTQATVKMELLNSSCRNTVKLSIPQNTDDLGGPKRCGTFVMYNCARLAMLFSHFNQAVEKGTYPEMPPVEEIDFSVLREEEEWILMFNYLWPYPDVVAEAVACLTPASTSPNSIGIHTHKVCNFLVSLSQHVSTYYSRCHILGESRPHLYALMFARLYLMKGVHQVMRNGLALMGIQPLNQL
ncbi:DALR anticodon-binding domain-containing protein 3-like [Liolophura sinensis]|uniref:DALR anticodon-binding domain-containing protein 3-like n=1 Tax=Liolophura sinensis TaxID=3198878 RepID=UPI003158FE56